MNFINLLEKQKKQIIDTWLADVIVDCQIENEAGCHKFLADYFNIILDNIAKFDRKSVRYLKKSLDRGFLSDYTLDQIFTVHLCLKHVLEDFAKENLSDLEPPIDHNVALSTVYQLLDKYFLIVLEFFGSQFNLLVNYYRDRHTNIAEHISEIVYSLSPRGNFNYISPSIKNTMGISPESLETIDDLIGYMPQGDREEFLQKFARQIKNKTELKIDLRFINKQKKRMLYFIHHSLPNLDSFGNLISIEGVLLDVTELKESEEKYRKLIETASDAIVVADVESGIILDVNKEAENLFGLPADKLIGLHQSQLHSKEDREKEKKTFQQHIQAGGVKSAQGVWVIHKDGHKIPVEISASVTELGGKKIIQGIFRDVTERKQAEEALEKKHHIQSVLNAILNISIQPHSLEEMLNRILKHMVSIPWLTLQSKGAILLSDSKSGKLVMKSSHKLPRELKTVCAKVAFGECICGLAASTKKLQFADYIDKRHVKHYKEISPHGHYCVPILSSGNVLGVLNLYVRENHKRNKDEEEFLLAISNGLAGIIERKYAEEELIKYRHHLEELVKERTALLTKTNKQLRLEITERKRAEEEIKKFKFMSDRSNDAYFLSGRDAKFTYVNKTSCRMLGYSEAELLTLGVPGVDINYDLARYQALFDLAQTEAVPSFESINKRKDGTLFPSEITVTGHQIDGKPHMLAALRDITKRKQADEILKKSEEKFKSLFDKSSESMLIFGVKGNILGVNDIAIKRYGYSKKEFLKLKVFDLDAPETPTKLKENVRRTEKEGYSVFERIHILKDGTKTPVEVSSGNIEYEGQKAFLAIVRDITERKQAEEELVSYRQHLEELVKERTAQLTKTNIQLRQEIAEREWAAKALRQSEWELSIRNRIADIFLNIPDEEVYAEVLQVILGVLESRSGIFGYINEAGDLVCPSMTKGIWNKCELPYNDLVFRRKAWDDILHKVLLEKTAFFSNKAFPVPKGHVPISRAVGIPIINKKDVIGVILVANKMTDYIERDRQFLESIAGYIAPILNVRLQRDSY